MVPAAGRDGIAVVDYHKGNLQSVERGLMAVGASAFVTDDPRAIVAARGIVVPGVGAFDDAMGFMEASGEADAIRSAVAAGVPLLGICLGMQLLFSRGNEHAELGQTGVRGPWVAGLGLMDGDVERMDATGVKVPHVGWNSVEFTSRAQGCPLLAGIGDGSYFYFTHSYVCKPASRGVLVGTTTHAEPFASVVWDAGRVFGVQFHPEKSSETGLSVLRNFADVVRGA